ncbi:hypothetical protein CFBP6624_23615 [Agrobacterium tumefaciens]|uniref:Uncharacterized protein n=1 Tax=Agrobacterium tumefaciens TaxID=358 RepID=A0AAE6BTF7_AGRTU|nr:hypothetical protein CFBP6623_23810 [Agrobacterium tumefaciens]QCM03116.1 hypothetical protein CFBP6624_23615 [Agrobacterium tumefaciens]
MSSSLGAPGRPGAFRRPFRACSKARLRAFSLFFESRNRSNSLFCRISGRKTGFHFSSKCSSRW